MASDGRITRVDLADEPAMSLAFGIIRDAYLADDPDDPFITFPEVLASARNDRSMHEEFWLMRADGRPVSAYQLSLPLLDNTDFAEFDLGVAPAHQGRGHGRAMLEHGRARIAEHNRHQVVTGISEPVDGSASHSTRFAMASGARKALGEVRRTLHLDSLDHDRLAVLQAEAEQAAAGYQLVSWSGPSPDDLVDGYAALIARMSTDAPMGDLDIEPEKWDAERIRRREEVIAAQGRVMLATAARIGADGPLVAFTDIVVTRHDPPNAFQWDTLVVKEHRGHRLGMLVKIANLQRLLAAAPDVRRVHTWNADINSWMIAVNEAMGFRIARREAAWRLDLPRDSSGTEPAS